MQTKSSKECTFNVLSLLHEIISSLFSIVSNNILFMESKCILAFLTFSKKGLACFVTHFEIWPEECPHIKFLFVFPIHKILDISSLLLLFLSNIISDNFTIWPLLFWLKLYSSIILLPTMIIQLESSVTS